MGCADSEVAEVATLLALNYSYKDVMQLTTSRSKMDLPKQLPYVYPRRFDKIIYDAALRHEVDATPLLSALESSRTLACGVASLLDVLRNHGFPEDEDNQSSLIGHVHTDELISLCIESMSLLNARIEALADQLFLRHSKV